jgi:hypothetical protein
MIDESHKYTMKISRKTVDELGVKLYDQVSAVVAETIANSYDADAESVTAKIPLNVWLATIRGGKLQDRGFEIIIEDDGHGMTPEEANEYYLMVGKDRRNDPRQGPLSRYKKRKVMGRKGIGKLAPFGICNEIEVWSSGGDLKEKGYEITNFILRHDDVVKLETEEDYHPNIGADDGKYSKRTGTKIILRNFNRRRISDEETFHRQMARRFSIGLPDFCITIMDATGKAKPFKIGKFEIPLMENARISVDDRPIVVATEDDEGNLVEEETLHVTGWVAFSQHPYRDEEMAGIRIYTRGKLATVTRDFGIKSGFTGENTIRSYLVGEINAEWIDPDEGEDLNRTDRQDILWNTARGRAFQEWGRKLLKELGALGRKPVQERTWHQFLEKTNLEEEARKQLKTEDLVNRAVNLGKLIGSRLNADELQDEERIKEVAEVVIAFAPQLQWVDTIEDIGAAENIDLNTIAGLFAEAKIGEIALLGRVAYQRLNAISKLRVEIDKEKEVDEHVLQKIIEEAPWLISPQWTVFGMTETFETIRERFEKWFEHKYKEKILTSAIGDDKLIPDFVLLNPGRRLEIVEIKKRWHVFSDKEYERLQKYIDGLDKFLNEHKDFQKDFGDKCHATLICDEVKLNPIYERAFNSLESEKRLEHIPWNVFFTQAENAHRDFISALKEPTVSL